MEELHIKRLQDHAEICRYEQEDDSCRPAGAYRLDRRVNLRSIEDEEAKISARARNRVCGSKTCCSHQTVVHEFEKPVSVTVAVQLGAESRTLNHSSMRVEPG
jgi:hypothetical protein